LHPARRRANPYVQALHGNIRRDDETGLKRDRLFVGALIEARSCERFTRLLVEIEDRDPEVSELLFDLGPAEKRHWEAFHALAVRGSDARTWDGRWQAWLAHERDVMADRGTGPTVHG